MAETEWLFEDCMVMDTAWKEDPAQNRVGPAGAPPRRDTGVRDDAVSAHGRPAPPRAPAFFSGPAGPVSRVRASRVQGTKRSLSVPKKFYASHIHHRG